MSLQFKEFFSKICNCLKKSQFYTSSILIIIEWTKILDTSCVETSTLFGTKVYYKYIICSFKYVPNIDFKHIISMIQLIIISQIRVMLMHYYKLFGTQVYYKFNIWSFKYVVHISFILIWSIVFQWSNNDQSNSIDDNAYTIPQHYSNLYLS